MREIITCLVCFCSLFSAAQNTSPTFKNVQIDIEDGTGYAPCEPSIAISQKNPKKIVAGAILDKVYTSKDGGVTWTKERLKSDLGVYGDPCVINGKGNQFYYFHLSDPAGKGWADQSLLDRIVCQRSKNMKKWSSGTSIGLNGTKDQDKEWAVFNPYTNEVLVTWTQFDKYASKKAGDSTVILFSKADKNIKEFSKPIRISQIAGDCIDGDETTEGAVPDIGPNGEIYVAWAVNETIYFDRSIDGGNTWLEEDIAAVQIAGGWDHYIPGINRTNGMPVLRCDRSGGKFNGRIYINWTDQRNGEDDTDVFMAYSDDKGETWSNAIKVNQDDSERHQFFTWMDIDNASGAVYMVFYDRRNSSGNETEVYLARSLDGGDSFQEYKISESSFVPSENVFFGDYNNISAHNGSIRPIWTRYDKGKLSIWTALIEAGQLN